MEYNSKNEVEICIYTAKYMSLPLAFPEDRNPHSTPRKKMNYMLGDIQLLKKSHDF
jgi:hypothetical protein